MNLSHGANYTCTSGVCEEPSTSSSDWEATAAAI